MGNGNRKEKTTETTKDRQRKRIEALNQKRLDALLAQGLAAPWSPMLIGMVDILKACHVVAVEGVNEMIESEILHVQPDSEGFDRYVISFAGAMFSRLPIAPPRSNLVKPGSGVLLMGGKETN